MRKFFTVLVLAASTLATGLTQAQASVETAPAGDGWVYVVVNDRVCGSSGVKARGILATVRPTGWTTGSWDMGDNIIYPKVRFGTTNVMQAEIMCQKKQYGVWITVGYRTLNDVRFTPSYGGQTIWVG